MIILNFCVACGDSNPEHLHQHHLIPRSCGGSDDATNKITLCCICHGKLHGVEWNNSHPALIAAGMRRAQAKGTRSGKPIGRPALAPQTKTAIREAYKAGGASMRGVAKRFNVSVETVRRSLAA
jgi:hypothetical protein